MFPFYYLNTLLLRPWMLVVLRTQASVCYALGPPCAAPLDAARATPLDVLLAARLKLYLVSLSSQVPLTLLACTTSHVGRVL